MSQYINLPEMTATEKCVGLANRGATSLSSVPKWEDIPENQTLICVGDRGIFQYAAVVYGKREYDEFTSPNHMEPQFWFIVDSEKIESLLNPVG